MESLELVLDPYSKPSKRVWEKAADELLQERREWIAREAASLRHLRRGMCQDLDFHYRLKIQKSCLESVRQMRQGIHLRTHPLHLRMELHRRQDKVQDYNSPESEASSRSWPCGMQDAAWENHMYQVAMVHLLTIILKRIDNQPKAG